jgi:hypothetical protein
MPSESSASNSSVITGGTFPPPAPKPLPPKKVSPPQADEAIEPAIAGENAKAPQRAAVPPAKPRAKSAVPAAAATVPKPKPAAAVPRPVADEEASHAVRSGWRQWLVVYGVSTAIHGILLLVMAFIIILPPATREKLLDVFVESEEPVAPPPPPMDHMVQDPDIIEEERALEDATQDVTALVTSDVDGDSSFSVDFGVGELTIGPGTGDGPPIPGKIGNIAAGRSEAVRAKMLSERGGNSASDASVVSALDWIASVQRTDGSWDFNDVGKAGNAGKLSSPTGATGLALMAFLGAGHTHTKDCKYQENVKKGINFLLSVGIERPAGLDFR